MTTAGISSLIAYSESGSKGPPTAPIAMLQRSHPYDCWHLFDGFAARDAVCSGLTARGRLVFSHACQLVLTHEAHLPLLDCNYKTP